VNHIDTVIEIPLEPKGQQRHRTTMGRDGRPRTYIPTSTTNYQAAVFALAKAALPPCQIEGPVRLDILAVVQRPKYLLQQYKDGRHKHPTGLIWAPCKPDKDNIEKIIFDAFKTLWRDDAQVCMGDTLKAYAEVGGRPRIIARLRTELPDITQAAQALGLLPGGANA